MSKNSSIKQKLAILLYLLIVIFIGLGGITFYQNQSVSTRVDKLSEEDIPTSLDMMRLQTCVVQIQQWLTDISATRAAEGLDDGYDEAETYYKEATDIITRLHKNYNNNEIIGKLQADLDAYYDMGKKMADKYINEGTAAGNEFMLTFDPYAAKITEEIQTLVDNVKTDLNKQNAIVVKRIHEVTRNLIIVFVAVVILVSIFFAGFSNSIIQPIVNMGEMLKDISSGKGDLTKRLEIVSRDEIGEMSSYFNTFIGSLQEIISKMVHNIANVEEVTVQVSMAMDTSNEGVTEVNAKVEGISASVAEILELVHDISSHSSQMSSDMKTIVQDLSVSTDKSVVIKEHSNVGSNNLKALDKMINSVAENTNFVFQSLESLEQSSNEIQEIIAMVRSIADQTQLLALNANIEAARAGEHGKGFAVVAAEVSKLAQDSISSVDKIEEIIQEIQRKSRLSFESITEGKQLVTTASSKVNDTSSQFYEISSEIYSINKLMSDALMFMKEQSNIANNVSSSVNDIKSYIDETSGHLLDVSAAMEEQVATVQEVTASLEEASLMTTALKNETNQFKI